VQATERLKELLQQAVKQLAPFGARADALTGLAEYIGTRALQVEANLKTQEM
jgi:hypothetical protein